MPPKCPPQQTVETYNLSFHPPGSIPLTNGTYKVKICDQSHTISLHPKAIFSEKANQFDGPMFQSAAPKTTSTHSDQQQSSRQEPIPQQKTASDRFKEDFKQDLERLCGMYDMCTATLQETTQLNADVNTIFHNFFTSIGKIAQNVKQNNSDKASIRSMYGKELCLLSLDHLSHVCCNDSKQIKFDQYLSKISADLRALQYNITTILSQNAGKEYDDKLTKQIQTVLGATFKTPDLPATSPFTTICKSSSQKPLSPKREPQQDPEQTDLDFLSQLYNICSAMIEILNDNEKKLKGNGKYKFNDDLARHFAKIRNFSKLLKSDSSIRNKYGNDLCLDYWDALGDNFKLDFPKDEIPSIIGDLKLFQLKIFNIFIAEKDIFDPTTDNFHKFNKILWLPTFIPNLSNLYYDTIIIKHVQEDIRFFKQLKLGASKDDFYVIARIMVNIGELLHPNHISDSYGALSVFKSITDLRNAWVHPNSSLWETLQSTQRENQRHSEAERDGNGLETLTEQSQQAINESAATFESQLIELGQISRDLEGVLRPKKPTRTNGANNTSTSNQSTPNIFSLATTLFDKLQPVIETISNRLEEIVLPDFSIPTLSQPKEQQQNQVQNPKQIDPDKQQERIQLLLEAIVAEHQYLQSITITQQPQDDSKSAKKKRYILQHAATVIGQLESDLGAFHQNIDIRTNGIHDAFLASKAQRTALAHNPLSVDQAKLESTLFSTVLPAYQDYHSILTIRTLREIESDVATDKQIEIFDKVGDALQRVCRFTEASESFQSALGFISASGDITRSDAASRTFHINHQQLQLTAKILVCQSAVNNFTTFPLFVDQMEPLLTDKFKAELKKLNHGGDDNQVCNSFAMIIYQLGHYLFRKKDDKGSQKYFLWAKKFQSRDGYIPGLDYDLDNVSFINNPKHKIKFQSINEIIQAYPNDPKGEFDYVYLLARSKMTNQSIDQELQHLDNILIHKKTLFIQAGGDRHLMLPLQLLDLKVQNQTKGWSNDNFDTVKMLFDQGLALIANLPHDNDGQILEEFSSRAERFLYRCSFCLSAKLNVFFDNCDDVLALSEDCFERARSLKGYWPDLKQGAQSSLARSYFQNSYNKFSPRKGIKDHHAAYSIQSTNPSQKQMRAWFESALKSLHSATYLHLQKAIKFITLTFSDHPKTPLPPRYCKTWLEWAHTVLSIWSSVDFNFATSCSPEIKQFIRTNKI